MAQETPGRKRRSKLPHKPNQPVNLWSIMKNCIGSDIFKVTIPVNMNEPLSMLQRLTENFEYSYLLDKAATCDNPCEQLAYVAAFTISTYSNSSNRIGKPFNPLLGETYECDRMEDLGWRCIAEQVSHHPPIAAVHCEGREWTCCEDCSMTTRFRTSHLEIVPMGITYVEFKKSGNRYGWRKVTTTINNIFMGKLWIDHYGDVDIVGTNNAEGIHCRTKFFPYSYFSRDNQRKVQGVIENADREVKLVLNGIWDEKIEIAHVDSTNRTAKSPFYRTIWVRRMPAPDCEKYYGFTEFACQLNEMEAGVAPTDSRMRNDQRLMEDGHWDESNIEKQRLEEKQRTAIQLHQAEAEAAAIEGRPLTPYEPMWFIKTSDKDNPAYVSKGTYWEAKLNQDWSQCPQIF